MFLHCFCAVLVVILDYVSITNGQDCTGGYTIINDPTRSTNSFVGDLGNCDDGLDENTWYRFDSYAGNQIPERAAGDLVPPNKCGTDRPIFTVGIGSHPTIDSIPTFASVCATDMSGLSCSWDASNPTTTITIYKCPAVTNVNSFYIYKLKAAPGCPMAYCAGEGYACDVNNMWDGFQCVATFPQMTGPPLFSGPLIIGSGINTQIYFTCTVQYTRQPNDGNARFLVTFLFNGQPLSYLGLPYKTLNPVVLQPGDNLQVILGEDYLQGRLGYEISCSANAYWFGFEQTVGPVQLSVLNFFVGIQSDSSDYHIYLQNGTTYTFTFTSTVPLTCAFCAPDATSAKCCQYIFRLKSEAAASCSVTWKTGTMSTDILVYIVPPTVPNDLVFQLGFKPYTDDAAQYASTALWHGYTIPPVKIIVPEIPYQYYVCYSTGDPHVRTFDWKSDTITYNIYLEGDFSLVYVNNPDQLLEIQVRHEPCNYGVTCICGVVVREGNSAVKVSYCDQGTWYGATVRTPTVTWLLQQNPDDASAVYRDGIGSKFRIQMPSGLRVEIDATHPWFTAFVYLPDEYHGQTSPFSMCGNSNGISTDDIRTNQNDYRLANANSYFQRQPQCSSLFNPGVVYCDCYNSTVFKCSGDDPAVTVASPAKIPFQIGSGFSSGIICDETARRRKRSVSQDDNVLDVDNLYPPYTYDPNFGTNVITSWPTPKGKTQQQVEDYCGNTFARSPAYSACATNADVQLLLSSCTVDVQVADDWIDITTYVNAFNHICIYTLISTQSDSIDENGTMSDSLALIYAQLCPNNCSGHGACSDATCTCYTGFMGADCSIDKTKPPTATGIIRNGLCDVQQRPCDSISVFGAGVADTSTLKCRFTNPTSGTFLDAAGAFATSGQVSCLVPGTPTHRRRRRRSTSSGSALTTLHVSIANDGANFSNPVTFVIYDSTCIQCNDTQSCTTKDGTCSIDQCYPPGSVKIDEPCLQCVPDVTKSSWTNVTVNKDWNACSRDCDYGAQNRDTVCNVNGNDVIENRGVQLCMKANCPANTDETLQGVGLDLPVNDLTSLLLTPNDILEEVATAVNNYCSKNPTVCCNSAGIPDGVSLAQYTSADLCSYSSGYPSIKIDSASIKIMVKIFASDVQNQCTKNSKRATTEETTFGDKKIIYDAVSLAKGNIEQALDVTITSVWTPTSASSIGLKLKFNTWLVAVVTSIIFFLNAKNF